MSVSDSTMITLPGRSRFRLPVVGTKTNLEQSGLSKQTPEWTIEIDDVFQDQPLGVSQTSVELFGFTYNTTRDTLGHSVSSLISSPSLRLSDVVVMIRNDASAPKLEQKMNSGTVIQNITITRYGWITEYTVLETRTFETCYITKFKQILDFLVLFIRTIKINEHFWVFNQDGKSAGNLSSEISVETGMIG